MQMWIRVERPLVKDVPRTSLAGDLLTRRVLSQRQVPSTLRAHHGAPSALSLTPPIRPLHARVPSAGRQHCRSPDPYRQRRAHGHHISFLCVLSACQSRGCQSAYGGVRRISRYLFRPASSWGFAVRPSTTRQLCQHHDHRTAVVARLSTTERCRAGLRRCFRELWDPGGLSIHQRVHPRGDDR